jgi:hypothetical protein
VGNCILSFPNRANSATLSGGSWSTALPLANLQNRRIKRVARTTDAVDGSFVVDGDFGKERAVRSLALSNINFSVEATFRFRLYIDAGMTELAFDSGVQRVFEEIYTEESEDWDSGNFWDLTISAEDREGLVASLIYVLPVQWTVQYFKLEVFDADNAAGYLQAGRLFLGGAWIPVVNMDSGAGLGYESRDEIDESRGGAEFYDRRNSPRVARIAFPHMTESEGWQIAFDMQRTLGTTEDLFFAWDEDDTVNKLRRSFLARMRQLSPIEAASYPRTGTVFELKEQI